MSGYRFALVLEDGEPADTAVFPTIIPTWREGDTFLGGAELQRFRIVEILPEWDRTRRSTDPRRRPRSQVWTACGRRYWTPHSLAPSVFPEYVLPDVETCSMKPSVGCLQRP